MIKKLILVLFSLTVILLDLFLVSLKIVSSTFNQPLSYFPQLFINYTPETPTNFLVLGLDPRDDALEKTQTTDTIMFTQLSPNAQLKIVSLPRDLWSYSLNTKINRIYPLSLSQPNQFKYIQDNFGSIIGQPVDRTIIITTQNLIDLVDIVGGVDVYLDQGFEDDKYPNPDYIDHPSPQTPIYKVIKFNQGLVHLDRSNITEFVRSRKSAETAASGGTDLGRIKRQQLLIDALIAKLKTIRQPSTITALYHFYHQNIDTNLTDQDIASLVVKLNKNLLNLSLQKVDIPAGENPQTDILYHPNKFINKQWVFIPQDKDYSRLHQFIKNSLHL